MSAVGAPELLLVILLGAGVVTAVVLASRSGARTPQVPVREARLVGLTRVVGVVAGFLAARAVSRGGTYGTGPMLAPAVFGTCVLLAVVAGETLVRPRRDPGVRSASLGVRRVRDYAPRVWVAVAAVLVLTTALLLFTTLTASPDETDGTARAVSCEQAAGGASAGPYPGSYYTGPLALALLVVLVVAGIAARRVVQRPRGSGDVGGDDALRRRSLRVVVAATGLAVGSSYVGVATAAASALGNLASGESMCSPGWAGPVATGLGVSVLPVAVLVLGCALILLRPGTPHGLARPPATAGPTGPAGPSDPVGPGGGVDPRGGADGVTPLGPGGAPSSGGPGR
ncbi:hypothetical protein GCM10027596_03130 [Nocardioides korecus]